MIRNANSDTLRLIDGASASADSEDRDRDRDPPLESLAWHELDPCCQREIDDRRKKKEVDSKLRAVDRSYARADIKSQLFATSNPLAAATAAAAAAAARPGPTMCLCCSTSPAGVISSFHSAPSDYPLLSAMRASKSTSVPAEERRPGLGGTTGVFTFETTSIVTRGKNDEEFGRNSDSNSDSDSDSDLGFDLDELTPFEQARMQAVNETRQRYEAALIRGFAYHIDLPPEQLSALIESGAGVSLVVHVVDPDSRVDALLDLALEQLATKYLGTMFRRTLRTTASAKAFVGRWTDQQSSKCRQGLLVGGLDSDRQYYTNGTSACCGELLVFNGRQLTIYTANLFQFGNEDEIYTNELVTFLDRAHGLKDDPGALTREQLVMQRRIQRMTAAGSDDDGSGEDDENGNAFSAYCDDPDCTRRYPHEHVGRAGRGATFAGTAERDQASEVLAKNTFYRL